MWQQVSHTPPVLWASLHTEVSVCNRPLLSGSGLQGQGLQSNNKPSQLQREGTQGDTMPSSQVREQEGLGDAVVMVLGKHSLIQLPMATAHIPPTWKISSPDPKILKVSAIVVWAQTPGAGSNPVNQRRRVLTRVLQGLRPGGLFFQPWRSPLSQASFFFGKLSLQLNNFLSLGPPSKRLSPKASFSFCPAFIPLSPRT